MNNADKPAMPTTEKIHPDVIAQAEAYGGPVHYEVNYAGLTKREHFAGLAIQQLVGLDYDGEYIGGYAREAVKIADALLEALEESK